MDSKNIDLVNARLDQAAAILRLVDPDSQNSALWAVQDLLDQAHEAANRLWEHGIAQGKAMQEATA